jgi:hypothetical protein
MHRGASILRAVSERSRPDFRKSGVPRPAIAPTRTARCDLTAEGEAAASGCRRPVASTDHE